VSVDTVSESVVVVVSVSVGAEEQEANKVTTVKKRNKFFIVSVFFIFYLVYMVINIICFKKMDFL
jgi:hypothetical protein